MKKILTTCAGLLLAFFLAAQTASPHWQERGPLTRSLAPGSDPLPSVYRALTLDLSGLVSHLRGAPLENTPQAASHPLALAFPMPDGTMEEFAVWESPIMEPGLSAAFPLIKTFAGRSLSGNGATVRFGYAPEGFHAIFHQGGKVILIVKYEDAYLSFFREKLLEDFPIACGIGQATGAPHTSNPSARNVAIDLHTYRLAISTTSEYSTASGGTVASVLAAVTVVINQVNATFERENAIRLILIDNTTETFFFPPNNSDPFENTDLPNYLNNNPFTQNTAYGLAGYDIGHVFGTQPGGGTVGLASVGVVCSTDKARGGSNKVNGISFYETVVHEIGHQFNAKHNFNNCDGENENIDTAYEPGGGSTIMCYAGACGNNSVQFEADDYFHINALERIFTFSRNTATSGGGGCAQVVNTNNNRPDVNLPFEGGFHIPIGTPFELTGAATDADGDDLLYNWEQYDLGPPSPLGSPIGTAPLFRSVPPNLSTTRIFPKIQTIVSNAIDEDEVLPTITRPLTFRFTARDNHEDGGSWSYEEVQFNSTAASGPFVVTKPNNAAVIWEVGQYMEVTWNVANSSGAPVNCANVHIFLSTDGGFTYPIQLLAGTPNDGSAFVVVPDAVSTLARVKVKGAGNVFFDISNADFTIVAPAQAGFALTATPESGQVCIPENFVVNLQTAALLGFAEDISFEVSGLPTGATAVFSNPTVTAGGQSVLTILTDDVTTDGIVNIQIAATANGVPVQTRTLALNFVNSDFSALAVLTPADGSAGVTTLPEFTWTPLANALAYDIEIATDPAFNNIVDSATGLVGNSYNAAITLEDNSVYYWRVRASNECGPSAYLDPAAFRTVSQTCVTVESPGNSVNIPGAGLPLIESVINIAQSGAISDLNVEDISGSHTSLGNLELRLKGPDGSKVILFSNIPCNGTNFNGMGFDDQSPLTLTSCPQANGNYKPAGTLSDFNGLNVQGDWTLELEVIETQGEGGTFQGWSLEYCASLQPESPFLVKNDTLPVPPNDSRKIYQNTLIVDDADNDSDELEFTVVKNTSFGFISVEGQQIGIGGHFTMKDVYDGDVEYTNTNPNTLYDYFTFTVDDGEGGFFGTPRYYLKLDENAPSAATEAGNETGSFELYPNPASAIVTVNLQQPLQGQATLTLTDVLGRQLLIKKADSSGPLSLDLTNVSPGAYLVSIRTAQGLMVKKLVVQQ